MSENDGDSILEDDSNSNIDLGVVNFPKRPPVHIDHIDISGTPVVNMENASQHYVTVGSISSQETLNLENVIVTNSRTGQVNGNITSLHHNTAPSTPATDPYRTLEYVSSPVVTLQEDHQGKFADGLVQVNNVNFVEMNDTTIKGSSGPLELYFDVPVSPMPTTSASSTQISQTTTSYMPRHEHQTPKAQLLVRAYSDFIQPLQQQLGTHHLHHSSQSTDHPEAILPDVLDADFVQLEQAVIPQSLSDFRKGGKYESQKRHIQMNIPQQKHSQNFSQHSVEVQVDSHSQKLIEQSAFHNEPLHSQPEIMHNQHIQHEHSKQQTYLQTAAIQQLPPKYHLQKQYNQQAKHLDIGAAKDDTALVAQFSHGKNMQETSVVIAQNISTYAEDQVGKSYIVSEKNESLANHIMPLVTRSGRPVRRRPEYLEYVNQNLKEEMLSQQNNRNINMANISSAVKVEVMPNNVFDEFDVTIDDAFDDDDNEIDNSNDEEHDLNGVYSSDGKKSLPHKKRIPRKLKNAKKHVKCFKCSECSEQFINQNQFAQHKQSHAPLHKPKLFSCEICNKGFETQLKFFEHLKSHYEPFKKHKCEVCNGEFATAELLQEHSLVHTKEHFKCNVCHKTFRKESMLEVHIKVAHLEEDNTSDSVDRPYTCAVCPRSFKSQLTLDSHIQSDHSDNLPEFNCEDCYRAFKTKAKLQAHRKVEHKDEVSPGRGAPKKKLKLGKLVKEGYECTICPRTFTHKNSLIYHIRGHTGERPHQCEQCGKAFYAASALKVHMRLHSGEKPYKCETCGKFFRQWGDLKYHTSSVHSDTRQFQCEFCGKDFKRKYCLVVHRRIHTGEKKYKCDHCQKCFRASSYLQNHKRIHTGERPYPCPDCGKPFRVRSDMKRHRNTHLRENNGSGSSATVSTSASSSAAGGGGNSTGNEGTSHVSSILNVRQLRQVNHSPNQVQIIQGSITSGQLGQLIIADGVPTVISDQSQPVRIMVSGITQQHSSTHSSQQPPPAHRHSPVTTISLSNNINSLSPDSPNGTSNLTPANSMTPEVIIMEESNSQPINLNILPRIITSGASSASHSSGVSGNEEYELIPAAATRGTMHLRDEEVCVWSGVHVFTDQ